MSILSSSPSRLRRGGAALAVVATGAALVLAPNGASAATAPKQIAYGGTAWGSSIVLSKVASAGNTAMVPMCTTKAPSTKSIRTAGTTIPGLGTIGALETTVSSAKSGGTYSSTTTATTAETSLLGGLITLKGIEAVAEAKHTSAGYTLSASTNFLGLKVAGLSLPTLPTPSKTLTLPGLGSITLNGQTRTNAMGAHTVSVTALKIVIGSNLLGVPTGTVKIGFARASLHDAMNADVSGTSYGTQISVAGKLVDSGPTAPVYLPCGGSSSGLLSNSTASVNVPSVLTTGVTHSQARSSDSSKSTTAITSSTLGDVSLLGGKVKLDLITARSVVTRTAKGITRSAAGTVFAGLTVMGKTYSIPVKPNTSFSLAGLGTLWVNRQVKTATGLHVYGLDLVLGKAVGSLPVGAEIIVASASSTVLPRV